MLNSFYDSVKSSVDSLLNTVGIDIQIGASVVRALIVNNSNAAIDLDGVVVFRQSKTIIVPDTFVTRSLRVGDRVFILGKTYNVVSVDGSPNTSIDPLPYRRITIQERLP